MMNNENGRSMVEMLGVLAIIGVLSVAGIAGYTMAMKKYRVNEVLNAASQLVVLAQAAKQGAGASGYDLTKLGYGTDDTVGGAKLVANCTVTPCVVECRGDICEDAKKALNSTAGSEGVGPYYTLS